VKVEMKVDWANQVTTRRPQTTARHTESPRSRAERRLWYIAVSREIEAGVASGRFSSQADAARACKVSSARVSQVG
jgi:hypothetical protein